MLNLCGHGIYRADGMKPLGPDGAFTLPSNVELIFWCDHGNLFDSEWEKFIRTGQELQDGFRGYIAQPKKGMYGRRFKSGDMCFNYRLGYGSGIQYHFNKSDGSPWSTTPIFSGNQALNVYLDQKGLWLSLKDIIWQVKKTQRGNLTLHWLACRELVKSGDARWAVSSGTNMQKDNIDGGHVYFKDHPKPSQAQRNTKVGKLNIAAFNHLFGGSK